LQPAWGYIFGLQIPPMLRHENYNNTPHTFSQHGALVLVTVVTQCLI